MLFYLDRKSGRFDEDIAREYFAQMVKSLAQLHAHDVVMGPCMKLTSVVITSKDHLHVKFATLDGVHARYTALFFEPECARSRVIRKAKARCISAHTLAHMYLCI